MTNLSCGQMQADLHFKESFTDNEVLTAFGRPLIHIANTGSSKARVECQLAMLDHLNALCRYEYASLECGRALPEKDGPASKSRSYFDGQSVVGLLWPLMRQIADIFGGMVPPTPGREQTQYVDGALGV